DPTQSASIRTGVNKMMTRFATQHQHNPGDLLWYSNALTPVIGWQHPDRPQQPQSRVGCNLWRRVTQRLSGQPGNNIATHCWPGSASGGWMATVKTPRTPSVAPPSKSGRHGQHTRMRSEVCKPGSYDCSITTASTCVGTRHATVGLSNSSMTWVPWERE